MQKDMAKEQHRVRELTDITEQQQKVLKIKTEEAAAATRKLRMNSAGGVNGVSSSRLALSAAIYMKCCTGHSIVSV